MLAEYIFVFSLPYFFLLNPSDASGRGTHHELFLVECFDFDPCLFLSSLCPARVIFLWESPFSILHRRMLIWLVYGHGEGYAEMDNCRGTLGLLGERSKIIVVQPITDGNDSNSKNNRGAKICKVKVSQARLPISCPALRSANHPRSIF